MNPLETLFSSDYLPVCDDRNRVIGRAPRRVVHDQGLRHRAIHIVVQSREGKILIQRRGSLVDTFPDHWAPSVGGHVDPGEEPDATAVRELWEELGMRGQPEPIGEHSATEGTGWEFVTVYRLISGETPRCDGREVVDLKWCSAAEIEEMLADETCPTTPSLRETHALWSRVCGCENI